MKIIPTSIIIIVLQLVVFSLLWGNPPVRELFDQFENHPGVKSFDFIGGRENWNRARLLFHVAFMAGSIWIYLAIQRSLPMSPWQKGVCFGALIGFFRFIPEAFNLWTMTTYPTQLIQLRLILGIVSFIIFGVIVAMTFDRYASHAVK